MPRFLIELPADEPERARRFWQKLLQTTLESRQPEEGRGWQTAYEGITFGWHERGPGPGDRFSLPYFPVTDLAAAVERVRALGGEIVHPGEVRGTPNRSPADVAGRISSVASGSVFRSGEGSCPDCCLRRPRLRAACRLAA